VRQLINAGSKRIEAAVKEMKRAAKTASEGEKR